MEMIKKTATFNIGLSEGKTIVDKVFESQKEYEDFVDSYIKDNKNGKIIGIHDEKFINESIDLVERKAQHAIWWIDGLSETDKRQNEGELGDEINGFCCLGYGCYSTNIDYDPNGGDSLDFSNYVGLSSSFGFYNEKIRYDEFKENFEKIFNDEYYPYDNLAKINDRCETADFKNISKLLKENPFTFFEEKVAILLEKHYNVQ